MSFSSLPNELISQIISTISAAPYSQHHHVEANVVHNENHPSDESLVNLARVPSPVRTLSVLSTCSRRIHNLAEPYLYSSFTETGETSVLAFLRTILETPRLASLVKTYQGTDTRTSIRERTLVFSDMDELDQEGADLNLKELLLLAIQRGEINLGGSFLWFEDILDGNWDAATALIISCLPNLLSLVITVSETYWLENPAVQGRLMLEDPFDAMAFRWINSSLRSAQDFQSSGSTLTSGQGLQKLEAVKLVLLPSAKRWAFTSNILGFLHLTSLKKFEADGLWLVHDTDMVTYSIPSILINNCSCLPDHNATIFKSFRDVESFDFTAAEGLDFAAGKLVSEISHLNSSLRELTIKGCDSGTPIHHSPYRPSLVEFNVLEKLDIMAPHLIEWKELGGSPAYEVKRISWDAAMPYNLKTLIIRRCVQSTVIEAINLVGRKSAGWGRLEALHLEFMHDFPSKAASKEVVTLTERCLVAGLTLTLDWDGRWLV